MKVTVESVFTQSQDLCEELLTHVETRRKLLALVMYATLSAAFYGATMGMHHSPEQAAASAAKLPILFLVTLAICLPSLHFLGLLFGSTIRLEQTGSVLTAGICRTSILLSAFAPISLFFLFCGSEYPFLLLMHVAIFTICGSAGLVTIVRDFAQLRQRMRESQQRPISAFLLHAWMLLYMFVGLQMAFNLSPFVNRAGAPVTLFNRNHGNVYFYLAGVFAESTRR